MPLSVEADLEQELDRLFGLPLDEFTDARNQLAKRARDEGQRAIAARIRELRKPTVSAWLVNRLTRERELDVQRLLKAGERLTEAQRAAVAGRDAEAFVQARADEQRALTQLASAAREIADRERLGAGTLERVTKTLRAAAVTDEGRELLRQGRLSEDLEPTGFEALAGITAASPRRNGRARASRDTRREGQRAAAEARLRLRELRKLERETSRAAQAAEKEAQRAEEQAAELRVEAERAREEAAAAAAAVSRAEAELARISRDG